MRVPPSPQESSAAGPVAPGTLPGRMLATIDATVRVTTLGGLGLVLAVSLLLFLQWPLREVVQAYSREANDLAQVLFALYAGMAITYATRRDAHLAIEVFAARRPARSRAGIARIAAAIVLVPWSGFLLYAGWPMVAQSVRQFEGFPETFNPGYWVLKLAVALMAILVLLQAIVTVFTPDAPRDT
jgi:TRAP-type mannitol/chloroaromatic compound transport system permease small subunit